MPLSRARVVRRELDAPVSRAPDYLDAALREEPACAGAVMAVATGLLFSTMGDGFVPDLGLFVRGPTAALKRLGVIAVEDALPTYGAPHVGCALHDVSRWFVASWYSLGPHATHEPAWVVLYAEIFCPAEQYGCAWQSP